MSVYSITQDSTSANPKLQTFMVVAEKDVSNAVSEISLFLDECSEESYGYQVEKILPFPFPLKSQSKNMGFEISFLGKIFFPLVSIPKDFYIIFVKNLC